LRPATRPVFTFIIKEKKLKKGRIRIDEERCKGCLLCVEECPKNEIKKGGKINRFGYTFAEFCDNGSCNACTLCAIVCPDCAIEVIEITEDEKK
jgi:2-oxoglutarate ferredoxin oxidoreductase subunit delta